jgi:hypothetical protein
VLNLETRVRPLSSDQRGITSATMATPDVALVEDARAMVPQVMKLVDDSTSWQLMKDSKGIRVYRLKGSTSGNIVIIKAMCVTWSERSAACTPGCDGSLCDGSCVLASVRPAACHRPRLRG